ncbi:hypothetical protein [Streptomyces sp. BK239]|nr:hypothetical protein [Streptomyces sp. BK239]
MRTHGRTPTHADRFHEGYDLLEFGPKPVVSLNRAVADADDRMARL